MKPVVEQLPKDQIIAELTPDRLLRKTNNGNNEVYIFDNNTSPVLMHEVGRVREITFRHAGGGTGRDLDIDEFGVDKEHRRQGIASELISFIRNYAKEQGFEKLELNMWEFNETALAFYEQAGFKTYRRYMEMDLTEKEQPADRNHV